MAGDTERTMTRQTTHHYLVPALIPLYAVILMVINGHVKGPYMVGGPLLLAFLVQLPPP
jgi:hypothetical protein